MREPLATAAPVPAPAAAPPARHVPHGFFVAGEILACDLTAAEKLLFGLMAILSRQSGQAYASVNTYAARLGVNARTVQRLLRDLERRGFIVQDRPGGGGRIATVYRLRPPAHGASVARQIAAPTGKASPDKADPDPRQFAAPTSNGCPDKIGAQPRQNAALDVDEGRCNDRGEGGRPPSPKSRTGTGNGNGDGTERILTTLFPGKATDAQRAAGVNAITEARRQGASDEDILAAIADPSLATEFPKPWQRIERGAMRKAAARRRATTPPAAKAPAPQPIGAAVAEVAARINTLGIREARHRESGRIGRILGASAAEGIRMLSPSYMGIDGESVLRTDSQLAAWDFGEPVSAAEVPA